MFKSLFLFYVVALYCTFASMEELKELGTRLQEIKMESKENDYEGDIEKLNAEMNKYTEEENKWSNEKWNLFGQIQGLKGEKMGLIGQMQGYETQLTVQNSLKHLGPHAPVLVTATHKQQNERNKNSLAVLEQKILEITKRQLIFEASSEPDNSERKKIISGEIESIQNLLDIKNKKQIELTKKTQEQFEITELKVKDESEKEFVLQKEKLRKNAKKNSQTMNTITNCVRTMTIAHNGDITINGKPMPKNRAKNTCSVNGKSYRGSMSMINNKIFINGKELKNCVSIEEEEENINESNLMADIEILEESIDFLKKFCDL